MPVTSIQFGQVPWKYANGLQITRTSTVAFTIGTGSILDSTGVYQMTNATPITVLSSTTGLNGLDTGTIAASTVYTIFLVGDPVTLQTVGAVISLSATPYLPTGYSVFSKIGYITTNSSSQFLLGYWSTGNSTARLFMYDAPQATAITAGASTTYAAVTLTPFVPLVNNTPVWIYSVLTPGAAGHQLFMQPQAATGDAVIVTGQVTSVVVTSNSFLLSSVNSTNQQINYKVTNSGDAVAISVAGYQYFI